MQGPLRYLWKNHSCSLGDTDSLVGRWHSRCKPLISKRMRAVLYGMSRPAFRPLPPASSVWPQPPVLWQSVPGTKNSVNSRIKPGVSVDTARRLSQTHPSSICRRWPASAASYFGVQSCHNPATSFPSFGRQVLNLGQEIHRNTCVLGPCPRAMRSAKHCEKLPARR